MMVTVMAATQTAFIFNMTSLIISLYSLIFNSDHI